MTPLQQAIVFITAERNKNQHILDLMYGQTFAPVCEEHRDAYDNVLTVLGDMALDTKDQLHPVTQDLLNYLRKKETPT